MYSFVILSTGTHTLITRAFNSFLFLLSRPRKQDLLVMHFLQIWKSRDRSAHTDPPKCMNSLYSLLFCTASIIEMFSNGHAKESIWLLIFSNHIPINSRAVHLSHKRILSSFFNCNKPYSAKKKKSLALSCL